MQTKGMRRIPLAEGKVHVFSDTKRIILQVRATGPDDNPLVTWAKAAADLSPADAVQLASELFTAAMQHERTAKKPAGKDPPKLSNNAKPKPNPRPASNSTPKPQPNSTAGDKGPINPTAP